MAKLSTRDKNLIKIGVALPCVIYGVGRGVFALLCVAHVEKSAVLASIGAITVTYYMLRIGGNPFKALRSLRRLPRKTRIKQDTKHLATACGASALVTGCTAGLGLAFVEGLVERKVKVVMVSRSQTKLDAEAARLRQTFGDAQIVTLAHDFLGGDQGKFYEEILPAVLKENGVGLVINNVGLGTEDPQTLAENADADIAAMIQVNCATTTRMCKAVLPHLQGVKGGGAVVNVSSGSANQPTPYLSVYAATKAYITHFSRSLQREQIAERTGVRVLVAQPYYISGTGLFKSSKSSFNAPPASVVVDGTLKDLRTTPMTTEISHTNPAHAFIHFLFVHLAEDPALAPINYFVARFLGFNHSMTTVMTKARKRFLAKKDVK